MGSTFSKSTQEALDRKELPDMSTLTLSEKLDVALYYTAKLNEAALQLVQDSEEALILVMPTVTQDYNALITRMKEKQ